LAASRRYGGNWQENFAQTDTMGRELLPDDTRRRVREYAGTFLEREAARFAAWVAAGRSRDCHGDLQAQHVCCVEPVQIFDCIEFNHRFRFGDVAGEIAFLAMDLERLGRPDLAIRFLNAYLEENGDYEAVPLLDFYRSYRAWVRAKGDGLPGRRSPGAGGRGPDSGRAGRALRGASSPPASGHHHWRHGHRQEHRRSPRRGPATPCGSG
jgi:aminoglycoside phosphotransferase family enzyme